MKKLDYLLNNKKALLLDIDNTIFDYSYSHDFALDIVCKTFNITLDQYNKAKSIVKNRIKGVNKHNKLLYFKQLYESLNYSYSDILKINKAYEKAFLDSLRLDTSIFYLIKTAVRKNIKVAAISNFNTKFQLEKLDKFNLLNYFDLILTSEDCDVEKPHPYIFQEALYRLNEKPEKCLMIGDSIEDIPFLNIEVFPYNCHNKIYGLAGKSGCGKTTISMLMKELYDNVSILSGDNYHKYERDNFIWNKLTHYNVIANNLDKLNSDIENIFYNKSFEIQNYDHDTGSFNHKYIFPITKNIVIEGLHTFIPKNSGKYLSYKIFIDNKLSDDLKIHRDVLYRNKNKEEVLKSIINREKDYKEFIEPQKNISDIIISVTSNKIKFKFKKENFIQKEVKSLYEVTEDSKFLIHEKKYNSMIEYREIILTFLQTFQKGFYYVDQK